MKTFDTIFEDLSNSEDLVAYNLVALSKETKTDDKGEVSDAMKATFQRKRLEGQAASTVEHVRWFFKGGSGLNKSMYFILLRLKNDEKLAKRVEEEGAVWDFFNANFKVAYTAPYYICDVKNGELVRRKITRGRKTGQDALVSANGRGYFKIFYLDGESPTEVLQQLSKNVEFATGEGNAEPDTGKDLPDPDKFVEESTEEKK